MTGRAGNIAARARRLFAPETAEPPIVPPSGWSAWLIALTAAAMAFLAVLTLAAALAAGSVAGAWRADLAEAATVRLPAGTEEADVRRVLTLLRATPGIASARPLGREEQAALLAPWLGDGATLPDLPMPVMIDIRIEDGGPDEAALGAGLDFTLPGAAYDDHDGISAPLARTAGQVRWLALAGALLVLAAAGAMVAIAARASLAANAGIVRIIRLMGAEDGFILGAFVQRLSRRTAIGAAGGAAAAVGALLSLSGLGAGTPLELPLLPGLAGLAAVGVGVPVVLAAVGWCVARLTLGRALKEMD